VIRGCNHITLAVIELERSLAFYRDCLGFRLRAQWPAGAYLETGALWLCLAVDAAAADRPHRDHTHIAFDVDAEGLAAARQRLGADLVTWRENISEGESLYLLDPDGRRLELHIGSIFSRLAHYRAQPPDGMILFD
jgi:catechol 2,3-dioxygenase-like lactoylglutathione lyase family enzyme